jgi:hypothetical protein
MKVAMSQREEGENTPMGYRLASSMTQPKLKKSLDVRELDEIL